MSQPLNSQAIAEQDAKAIAAGRAAGAALEAGRREDAAAWWAQLPVVAGMPTLAEFAKGFEANAGKFGDWSSAVHFPAGGSAFSNACGSLARVLVYASHGVKAQKGSDAVEEWAYDWGIRALRAAGLEAPAKAAEANVLPAAVVGKRLPTAPVVPTPAAQAVV